MLYTFGSFQGDGENPDAGLILDDQGNLYGTTEQGGTSGAGTVFKISPAGKEAVLYNFTGGVDGYEPRYGSLVMDDAGNLYGTTELGGAFSFGTVFKLAPDGTESVLHSFNHDGVDGYYPLGGVVLDTQGNLYGTTSAGGSQAQPGGTVYKLALSGNETVLYSFNINGLSTFWDPETSLWLDKNNNL